MTIQKCFFICLLSFSISKIYALSGECIISLDNGKVLDADTRNLGRNGCKVQIWDFVANSANQKWLIEPVGRAGYDGVYFIKSATSKQYLSGAGSPETPIVLTNSFDQKTEMWLLIPIENQANAYGQGYYLTLAPNVNHSVLDVGNQRRTNGTPAKLTTQRSKPFEQNVAIWYIRETQSVGVRVTFKGISLKNIHNDDCKKIWGSVRAELWSVAGDGTTERRIDDPTLGDGELLNWAKDNTKRNVANYTTLTDYRSVNNVSRSVMFLVNPAMVSDRSRSGMTPDSQIRMGSVFLKVIFRLSAAHKSCDLCTDYTENAGFREQTVKFYLHNVLPNKENNRFVAKDGPMLAGPFRASNDNDHSYRLHFDIERLY